MKTKLLYINVFIMIFFSSIIGGTILGLSLNKLCILPLYIYLFITTLHMHGRIKIKKSILVFILFYFASAISAVYSLSASYSKMDGYVSRSAFYAIQAICIYIPLIILLYNHPSKDRITDATIKAIIITFRINIIIAIIEFLSFFVLDITVTKLILSIFYGAEAAPALINLMPLGIFIRPTGLNMDPAYLGIILVFGFLFEKNNNWKLAAFLVALIAMSRTAVIVMAVAYFYDRGLKKITVKSLLFVMFGIALFGILLMVSEGFRNQLTGLLDRFNLSSQVNSADSGTMRHLLYIPKAIEAFFFHYKPLQMLIGFGPRQSGTILAQIGLMDAYLNPEMFVEPWTLECDMAELLLGYGIIGFILYFYNIFQLRKLGKQGKTIFLIIVLYSIMYDISAATFVQLIIIICLCCFHKSDCQAAAMPELAQHHMRIKIRWRR